MPYSPMPVRLPDEIQKKVRREAKHEGLSISAVIRRILMRYYRQQKKAAA